MSIATRLDEMRSHATNNPWTGHKDRYLPPIVDMGDGWSVGLSLNR